jgi:probable DNA metabolism protein
MLQYIYDGSFNGLLTAIYEIYYRREIPDQLLSAQANSDQLFTERITIETEEIKAGKVYDAVYTKISPRSLRHTYYAYLSENPDSGLWIYQYLHLGWKSGNKLDFFLSNDRVQRIHRLSQKVSFECHRLLGLVRFQLLKRNIYYAAIEPDNNILELLAPHFAARMSDQNWVIHDVRRDIAAIYNRQEWVATQFSLEQRLELAEEEGYYLKLWQQYHRTIAIKSRTNPRLQRQCMPQRYWKHLVEMN